MNTVKQRIQEMLSSSTDEEVLLANALSMKELKKRNVIRSRNIVGDIGEYRVVTYYNSTPNETKLQFAPEGTHNVDALSRKGERYSIKTVTFPNNTTGTFHGLKTPEEIENGEKEDKIFEYLIVAILDEDYNLKEILEMNWNTFLKYKHWHSRMRAWNISISENLRNDCRQVYVTK